MEKDNFITKIQINKVRHLKDITIKLSDTERKHLIITGKNGSGKTSLYNGLVDYIDFILSNDPELFEKDLNGNPLVKNFNESFDVDQTINMDEPFISSPFQLQLSFSNFQKVYKSYRNKTGIFSCFDAKRKSDFIVPTGIKKEDEVKHDSIRPINHKSFIQYLVNLRAQKSFALEEGNESEAKEIDEWFEKFEDSLKTILQDRSLRFEFNRTSYNFNIIQKGKEPFQLNTLSDGYSAIMMIVSELMMRLDKMGKDFFYNTQGIVIIDEIESHLHIELQKNVLPILTTFFPKIQFIVTTHSPFVIGSLENAVVFDLEKQERVEDLTPYSVNGIIENYFGSDKYSSVLKSKIKQFEDLSSKKNLTKEDHVALNILKESFDDISQYMAPELEAKLQEIKLKNLSSL